MSTTTLQKRQSIYRIVIVGLMAALVYIGNYMQIKLQSETRVHLGNSMCLLAGLLFGSVNGGLSSGIGGALYDLFDPAYITSAPYTFFSKFSMGWVAGKMNRLNIKNEFVRTLIAAIFGQFTYMVLYLGKSFIEQLIIGNPIQTATTVMLTKVVTSSINGVLAVVISVPLYFAIKKALTASGFRSLINSKSEHKGYFTPVTTVLTIFAIAVTAGFAIRLSADKKIKAAQEEKAAEYQHQIDNLNYQLEYIYEQLDMEPPISETEKIR